MRRRLCHCPGSGDERGASGSPHPRTVAHRQPRRKRDGRWGLGAQWEDSAMTAHTHTGPTPGATRRESGASCSPTHQPAYPGRAGPARVGRPGPGHRDHRVGCCAARRRPARGRAIARRRLTASHHGRIRAARCAPRLVFAIGVFPISGGARCLERPGPGIQSSARRQPSHPAPWRAVCRGGRGARVSFPPRLGPPSFPNFPAHRHRAAP